MEYREEVVRYSRSVLECFEHDTRLREEELWIDFTSIFRSETISVLTASQKSKWISLLRSRGDFVRKKRGISRNKALVECLESTEFTRLDQIECSSGSGLSPHRQTKVHLAPSGQPRPDLDYFATAENGLSKKANFDVLHPSGTQHTQSRHNMFPKSTSHGKNAELGHSKMTPPHFPRTAYLMEKTFRTPDNDKRGSHAIGSLMKAYARRRGYSGRWDKDIDSAIEVFDTLADTYALTDSDKERAIPIMLRDDALSFYSTTFRNKNASYVEIVNRLREWFTSEEQRNGLLRVWQRASLSKAMRNKPNKSKIEVFRQLSHHLSRIQNQLDKQYHKDSFLKDQLVMAADLPHLERSLRERVPKTAHETMHRIAASLSGEPKSAGANFVALRHA